MFNPGAVLLEAQKIGCRVAGRILWQRLSFQLRSGERLGISGPSGSGKTILLRTLTGLAPLQEGQILFQGQGLGRWHMPDYRARVVYLAQRPSLPEGTVEAALRAPFRFRAHGGRAFPRDRLAEYMQVLRLETGFLAQRTGDLSGGESQLAAALRALLLAPRVVLLDEPAASLDARAEMRLESLVQQWLDSDPQSACIWTSHDRAQLERMSDRRVDLNVPQPRQSA